MTRYGIDVLLVFLLVCLITACIVWFFVSLPFVRYTVIALLGCLAILVVNFFRDPERTVPSDPHLIVSPADGKIVRIASAYEPEFLRQEALQISIFMSPLDVHVNRIPVSGTVKLLRHTPGKFIAAFADKASDVNEHMTVGIERTDGGKILMKQIAGTVARRIVADLQVGDDVVMGQRFGMIKFGSRVDLFLPKTITVNARMHERVTAGVSILATYQPIA